jgi:polyhydroxyalkanoate synthesis regulator phasin
MPTMPEEHQDDPAGREPRLDELERQIAKLAAKIDAQAQRAQALPPPKPEEPLVATVRKLKWMRQDLDSLIAHFDALLAAWQRQQATGEVATLPELTRRVKDLEARLAALERREREDA